MEKYSKATFLNWLELDNELEEWAAGYFGRYVRTSGYRDGQSMYVCVHLKPDDKQKYVDLVKDSEEIGTEPNQAWETFNEDVEPLLPEDTSMKIMSEILGWQMRTACTSCILPQRMGNMSLWLKRITACLRLLTVKIRITPAFGSAYGKTDAQSTLTSVRSRNASPMMSYKRFCIPTAAETITM